MQLTRESLPLPSVGPSARTLHLAPHWRGAADHLLRLMRTAREIPPPQLAALLRFMALQRLYGRLPTLPIRRARRAAAGTCVAEPLPSLLPQLALPIAPATLAERTALLATGRFAYLGRAADFTAGIRWRDPNASPLWAFNLHYLGAVAELVFAGHTGVAQRVLASWVASYQDRWDPVAWHPYPASLRLINLCVAAGYAGRFEALGDQTLELVRIHAAYLLRHLEYHLRGNHLLENACALLFAARFLRGSLAADCEVMARRLFVVEVPEQILPDGAHFELSPMYHAIAMHRLLQAIALLGDDDPLVQGTLAPAVVRMANFLVGVLCPDGDIPLLGDSSRGFAPHPSVLLDLARQLGVAATLQPADGITSFGDCGLHVLRTPRLWAVFDAGPVCPPYLPGHGQADSLTVEVWCDGACVVGDPGIHDYTGPERAWGRSSRAHSTLSVDDADTSEVYGSFRVGGRAQIAAVSVEPHGVTATLRPFGLPARMVRSVRLLDGDALEVVDSASVPAGRTVRSRLHLHPDVRLVEPPSSNGKSGHSVLLRSPAGYVRISAPHLLRLEPGRASRRYGLIEPTTIMVQELQRSGGAEPVVAGRWLLQPLEAVG